MEIKLISPLIRNKKPWRRLMADDATPPPMTGGDHYAIPDPVPGMNYRFLSQEDLIKESTEGAHVINSGIYSLRPVYEVIEKEIEYIDDQGIVQKKTVSEQVIVGFDPVETVRSGLPDLILRQKASHLGKNGIEIADESGKDREAFDILSSYIDSSGINTAWLNLLYIAGKCGDGAMYVYCVGDEICFTMFDPSEGDRLFQHRDERGREFTVRLYSLSGRDAVDIYHPESISTWVRGDLDTDTAKTLGEKSWWEKIKGWFRNQGSRVGQRTEDGWVCVNDQDAQIHDGISQLIYLRLSDTFIGQAMQNIDALDRAYSYTSDKMRSTAFSKLLVKAFKIKELPPTTSGEEVIGIEGDAEQLKASDVKPIAPPDISNIAPINIKNIRDAVMESTMTVDLPPEILKSGADSSLTLKILFRREEQWCHVQWPIVYNAARHVVAVMKSMTDKLEKGGGRFTSLRLSIWNTPWLPQDEDALADRMCKLSYASLISQRNGRRELNLQYADDEEQVRKEQEEKIYRETFIRIKAEAEARRKFGLEDTADDVVAVSDKTDSAGKAKGDNSPRPEHKDPSRQGVDNNAPNR